MPGILPMKVIQIGATSQNRIAQACDRCRSKKIRCDGITPCCSQCANVGFECKTSDKLSRRAFPRGYTESLEERVRVLEAEVRELKVLLDEKDEKIDLLSKFHSFSPYKTTLAPVSPPRTSASHSPALEPNDDAFWVHQSPCLVENEKSSDSYFFGQSSGRAFVDAFSTKLHESGKATLSFSPKAFFRDCSPPTQAKPSGYPRLPPRLVADRLVNVFFQEWAPLLPVLHRPTFLKSYAEFVANPDDVKDHQTVAQINLVFELAAVASESNLDHVPAFEAYWRFALDQVIHDNCMATLQCLVLAQLCCITKADNDRMLYFGGVAVEMSHRLGLHQSQKRIPLDTMTRETRKKVFWSLYSVDCFNAAVLGLPKLIKDEDIGTEEPADIEDENVTESAFHSASPAESTKVSSALAFFRLVRILSKVLAQIYPAVSPAKLSSQKVRDLADELDGWRRNLAPHLRLEFVRDNPATRITGDRSPLLSTVYYYIRTLIHRPSVSSDIGAKALSSIIALSDSSKHIIQIVQLLKERRMSFTLPLNRNELLIISGFGLLYQSLTLRQECKLARDNHRLVCAVIELLEGARAPGAASFTKLACSLTAVEKTSPLLEGATDSRWSRHDANRPAPRTRAKSTERQTQAIALRSAIDASPTVKVENHYVNQPILLHVPRRGGLYSCAGSQVSWQSEPRVRKASSIETLSARIKKPINVHLRKLPNLDYYPLGAAACQTPAPAVNQAPGPVPPNPEWEHLIGYLESYKTYLPDGDSSQYISPDMASFRSTTIQRHEKGDGPDARASQSSTALSTFVLSDKSPTSGEERSNGDFGVDDWGCAVPTLAAEFAWS